MSSPVTSTYAPIDFSRGVREAVERAAINGVYHFKRLYLGRREYQAFLEYAAQECRYRMSIAEIREHPRSTYMGMEIFRVMEDNHLEVAG